MATCDQHTSDDFLSIVLSDDELLLVEFTDIIGQLTVGASDGPPSRCGITVGASDGPPSRRGTGAADSDGLSPHEAIPGGGIDTERSTPRVGRRTYSARGRSPPAQGTPR